MGFKLKNHIPWYKPFRVVIAGGIRTGTTFYTSSLGNSITPYTMELTSVNGRLLYQDFKRHKLSGTNYEEEIIKIWKIDFNASSEGLPTKGEPGWRERIHRRWNIISEQDNFLTKFILDNLFTKVNNSIDYNCYFWYDWVEYEVIPKCDYFIYTRRPIVDRVISANNARSTQVWNYDVKNKQTLLSQTPSKEIEWILKPDDIEFLVKMQVKWDAWAERMANKYDNVHIKDYSDDQWSQNFRWFWNTFEISLFRHHAGTYKLSTDPDYKHKFPIGYDMQKKRDYIKQLTTNYIGENT